MQASIPSRELFFTIKNQPLFSARLREIEEQKNLRHNKVAEIARRTLSQQKEQSQSSGWYAAASGLAKSIWNIGGTIWQRTVGFPDRLWDTYGPRGRVEKFKNQSYLERRQWILELGDRPEAQELSTLLNADIHRSKSALLQGLDPLIPHHWMTKTFAAIKNGNIKHLDELIENANTDDLQDAKCMLEDLRAIANSLAALEPVADLIACDLNELINASPLPQLLKLRECLQSGEGAAAIFDTLQEMIMLGDDNNESFNLLKQVKKEEPQDALEVVNLMIETMAKPLIDVGYERTESAKNKLDQKSLPANKLLFIALYQLQKSAPSAAAVLKEKMEHTFLCKQLKIVSQLREKVNSKMLQQFESHLQAHTGGLIKMLFDLGSRLHQSKFSHFPQVLLSQTGPLLEGIKSESDRRFCEQIANELENPSGNGLERVIEKFVKQSEDPEKSAVPFHLRRIFNYLVSPQGRRAIGDTAAKRILSSVLGRELPIDAIELDPVEFKDKMDTWLKRLLKADKNEQEEERDLVKVINAFRNWFFTQGALEKITDSQVIGPLLKRIRAAEEQGENGFELILTEWLDAAAATAPDTQKLPKLQALLKKALDEKNLAAANKVFLRRFADRMNGSIKPPTFAEVENRSKQLSSKLREQIGDSAEQMADALAQLTIEEILATTPQQLPKSKVVFDVSEFFIKPENAPQEPKKMLYMTNLGPLMIGIAHKEFKIALSVVFKEALLKSKAVLENSSQRFETENGFEYLCELGSYACRAITRHLDGFEDRRLNEDQAAQEVMQGLFGEGGINLGFTPFVQYIVTTILAPGKAGAAPFRLLGDRPILPKTLEMVSKGHLYTSLLEEIVAEKLDEMIEDFTLGGNIIDFLVKEKQSRQGLELSDAEQKFKEKIGELSLSMFERLDSYWHGKICELGLDARIKNEIGETMVFAMRDFISSKLLKDDAHEVSLAEMYNYVLKLGSEELYCLMQRRWIGNQAAISIFGVNHGKSSPFIEDLGKLLLRPLQQAIADKLNICIGDVTVKMVEEHGDNLIRQVFEEQNCDLTLTGKRLRELIEKREKEQRSAAIGNTKKLVDFFAPIRRHQTIVGVICAAVLHFIVKWTIVPLARLIDKINQMFCAAIVRSKLRGLMQNAAYDEINEQTKTRLNHIDELLKKGRLKRARKEMAATFRQARILHTEIPKILQEIHNRIVKRSKPPGFLKRRREARAYLEGKKVLKTVRNVIDSDILWSKLYQRVIMDGIMGEESERDGKGEFAHDV